METKRRENINRAFRTTLERLCDCFHLQMNQLSIEVNFLTPTSFVLCLHKNDKCIYHLGINELLNPKILALGMDAETLKHLFKIVHQAFMNENKVKDCKKLSLLLYISKKIDCPCVGVLIDHQPANALTISDVFDVMGLGGEQLN